jgi:hypothetical protein
MKLLPRKLTFWARRRAVPPLAPLLRALRRPLRAFKYNVHSQNGEDGVVAELFHRLDIRAGWLVEFGAWDGRHLSNTFRLLEPPGRFRAVYIEGDAARYRDLERTAREHDGAIAPIRAFVQPAGEDSLDNLLDAAGAPHELELLSIDVDGEDYHIWAGMNRRRPKVVIIEINSSIPPPVVQIHGPSAAGSSFSAMLELGRRKGYSCVCHIGNLVFVRDDLAPRLRLDAAPPETLFCRDWLAQTV